MPDHQSIPVPDGSVIITPAQQYAELRALTVAVNDLSSKVDPALVTIREDVIEVRGHLNDVRADVKAHVAELRIELSGLQKWRWMMTGALVLLASLVGWGALNLTKIGG